MRYLSLLVLCGLAFAQYTPKIPTSAPTDADLYVASHQATSTLNGAINSSVTSVVVATGQGSRFAVNNLVIVDSEKMRISAISTDTLTVVRGVEGSTAASHSSGATISNAILPEYHNNLKEEVKAAGSWISTYVTVSTSNPSGGCVNGRKHINTALDTAWECIDTVWQRNITSTGSGTYSVVGATGTSPCGTVAAGEICMYYDSTDKIPKAINDAQAVSVMVKAQSPVTNQWVTSIGNDGVQSTTQPSHTQLTNIGTNTHAQIDTFIASKDAASGIAGLDSNSRLVAAKMPAFTGDVASAAGSATNVLAAQYKIRVCEIHIWGDGAAGVLQDANDETMSCYNGYGVTETITAVRCWTNAGSPTVTPVITAGAGAILTGALTCTTNATAPMGAAGTLSGTPTLASGGTIDANITSAGGTATNLRIYITLTR
jgi:hypothetical protein